MIPITTRVEPAWQYKSAPPVAKEAKKVLLIVNTLLFSYLLECTPMSSIKTGDRVAYGRTYLRNTGLNTGWRPTVRGTVISIEENEGRLMAMVQWEGRPSALVNLKNLTREDLLSHESI